MGSRKSRASGSASNAASKTSQTGEAKEQHPDTDSNATGETMKRLKVAPEAPKVEAVLNEPPLLPRWRGKSLFTVANWIALVAVMARMNNQVSSTPSEKKETLKELLKLFNLLSKTSDHIMNMHRPAYAALERAGVKSHSIDKLVIEMIRTANATIPAHEEISALEKLPKRRRPKKSVEAAVTSEALKIYEALTGKRAGIKVLPYGGLFPDFIRDIFIALGLDPKSAGNQADQAIRARNQQEKRSKKS